MRRIALTMLLLASVWPAFSGAQESRAHTPKVEKAAGFDSVADAALVAMRAKAEELKISGVAVVAYFEGDTITSWSSKMVVVGSYKHIPTETDKGSNLLAVVYSKAAEMADTHQNSGSKVRPPMTGELGWQGGVIAQTKNGYAIAAFSGGKSEEDVQVSQAGVAKLAGAL